MIKWLNEILKAKKSRYLKATNMKYRIIKIFFPLLFLTFTSCSFESRQGQYFISNSIAVATKEGVIVCKLKSGTSDTEKLAERGVTSAWIEYRYQIGSSIENVVIDTSKKVLVLKVENNGLELLNELQERGNGSFGLYSGDRLYKVNVGSQSVYKINLGTVENPIIISLTCV